MFKCLRGSAPAYLADYCTSTSLVPGRSALRSAAHGDIVVPSHRTDWGLRSFAVAGPSSWNALPVDLRSSSFGLDTFAKHLKTHLFGLAYSRQGTHFWVCVTFCRVRHGDSVTKPDYYYYYYSKLINFIPASVIKIHKLISASENYQLTQYKLSLCNCIHFNEHVPNITKLFPIIIQRALVLLYHWWPSQLLPNIKPQLHLEFVISSLFLQPKLLSICLSPANLTTATLYSGNSKANLNKLQCIQNTMAPVITNTSKFNTLHQNQLFTNVKFIMKSNKEKYQWCLLQNKKLITSGLAIYCLIIKLFPIRESSYLGISK